MKSIWNGYLGFGLVNVPVMLYSALNTQAFGFRLLCKTCGTPIYYKRFCPNCNKEVAWSDVVKGIEISKGEYYTMTQEEINKLKPKNTDLIEIQKFIRKDLIDDIYLSKHYYIGPVSGGEKAYTLLKDAMAENNVCAIATFVLREKEYACVIESYKNGLLLTTLNYNYEIRDINEVQGLNKETRIKIDEARMATRLIQKLTTNKFDINDYKDTFIENIKELIRKKIKGEKIIIARKKINKTKNLMQALKASVKTK